MNSKHYTADYFEALPEDVYAKIVYVEAITDQAYSLYELLDVPGTSVVMDLCRGPLMDAAERAIRAMREQGAFKELSAFYKIFYNNVLCLFAIISQSQSDEFLASASDMDKITEHIFHEMWADHAQYAD